MSSLDNPGSLYDLERDKGAYDDEEFKQAIRVVRDVLIDRDNLFDSIAASYVGQVMTLEIGESFSMDAEKAMGWIRGAKAIRATIQYHNGEMLTESLLRRICWQISANEDMLQRGLPLSPRLEAYSGRWMIADIAGVDAEPSSGFAVLTFRALTGRAAGWSMKQDITQQGAYYIAGRLGFRGGRRRPWYQFDGDVLNLCGLYFAAFLEEERVSRFACTDPLWSVNRKIMRMRYRGRIDKNGDAFDDWGNKIPPDKLGYGCPLQLAHDCLDCQRKRHIVTQVTSGHLPIAGGDTCGAAF